MSKSEKKDGKGMSEQPMAATHPDPIPPVHVLEAAQDQEKKETEDLLAGFDRPGRGPKKPAEERDFVEYFAKKKSEPQVSTPGPGAVRPVTSTRPKQAEISTVVVPREKTSGVGTWVVAGVAMIALGGVVAFFATRDDSKVTPSVGAATTITNASPPPTTRTSNEEIPPPPPASEVAPEPEVSAAAGATGTTAAAGATGATGAVVTAPSGSGAKKRDPKHAGSASASSGSAAPGATTPVTSAGAPMVVPSSKQPPRDDFIRGM